ncbi:11613_t:CDS:2 [Funneliformis mosseae]|uniref:11613_t:CDS:1 n=1 Tax=Funneliformis mosseae TaxID=27381 RepID=A0A9N9C4W1_FUNMO|nr:11613_t:CDS:2 [Funneliformis mosseae]
MEKYRIPGGESMDPLEAPAISTQGVISSETSISLPFAGGLDCALDLVLESVIELPLENTNCQKYASRMLDLWKVHGNPTYERSYLNSLES